MREVLNDVFLTPITTQSPGPLQGLLTLYYWVCSYPSGRSFISRDHPVRLENPENPDNFILCPQDEQKTTAKSTLHFLDTVAKQAMFKAFQNLGRIEPQFDAADPSKRVYQFAVAPFVKVRSDGPLFNTLTAHLVFSDG